MAVIEAFMRLYEKGLIYRGTYMVNWCPRWVETGIKRACRTWAMTAKRRIGTGCGAALD